MTFVADTPDLVLAAAREGGGVILMRPPSDADLDDFPGVQWAGVELEIAVRDAAAGAYVWVAPEDGGWTFAVPLVLSHGTRPEVWLRTFRAGMRTGWFDLDLLTPASDEWIAVLARSDWACLLAHSDTEVREWAACNLWRLGVPRSTPT